MTRLTTRSSTIFIASGDATRVYHSLSDVPPALRRKLESSTRGVHSATILIADRRGREELVKALQVGAKRTPAPEPRPEVRTTKRRSRIRLVDALAVLVPVMIGIMVWLAVACVY